MSLLGEDDWESVSSGDISPLSSEDEAKIKWKWKARESKSSSEKELEKPPQSSRQVSQKSLPLRRAECSKPTKAVMLAIKQHELERIKDTQRKRTSES